MSDAEKQRFKISDSILKQDDKPLFDDNGKINRKMNISVHDIKLQTVPDAIATFEALFKAFYLDEIPRDKYGVMMYAFNTYVSLMRLAKELELEKTFERIENKLNEMDKQKETQHFRLVGPEQIK